MRRRNRSEPSAQLPSTQKGNSNKVLATFKRCWRKYRIPTVVTFVLAFAGSLAVFSKNVNDVVENVTKLWYGDRPKLEDVLKNLESEKIETRIAALAKFQALAINNKAEADTVVRILETYINRYTKPDHGTADTAQVADLATAFASLGAVLKKAEDKSLALRAPEFRDLDLSSMNLSDLYLSGTSFIGANFDEAILDRSDLSGALLVDVKFSNVRARSTKFSRTRIKSSCAEDSIFDDADMTSFEATSSDFNGATFKNGKLSGAKFDNSRLSFASFDGANLEYADLHTALEIQDRQLATARSSNSVQLPVPLYLKSTLTICKRK